MAKSIKIKILGQDWKIIVTRPGVVFEQAGTIDADALCLFNSRLIYVRNDLNKVSFTQAVTHEIIHATMRESGLVMYSGDETLTHWIDYHARSLVDTADAAIKALTDDKPGGAGSDE